MYLNEEFKDDFAVLANFAKTKRESNLGEMASSQKRYSDLLSYLFQRETDQNTAPSTLIKINEHWKFLNNLLNRNVGVFVAALDYFQNISTQETTHNNIVFLDEDVLNRLLDLSTIDFMTMLYNRRTFDLLLDKELKYCRRKKNSMTLVLADIDDFKSVNDRFGHLYGDSVLSSVAKILKQNLRDMDIAARYGGEEFVLLFPDTEACEAREIAERILLKIEDRFLGAHPVTISMGMATYPEVGELAQELIYAADQALYKAKAYGKNQLQE